ncbi:MAG TPA: Txe/YoeB family addiction module toxin [Flavobacteriales bacterium]|nr:Txe/YoeB family addiction module toxin [Flavobacteriales bacterium]HRE97234.1 Txe/YoeB family addiction module toxin [Flavobacteriales bacterium]HRJ38483.1 Txe/YoeB family addiction module toxin [Flavobacteriales bacterium]
MNIEFTPNGWEDFLWWQNNDPETAQRVVVLIRDICRSPFSGLGKPEALRYNLKGFWSRRITGEHRLVYFISGKSDETQRCTILQCRFHYDD